MQPSGSFTPKVWLKACQSMDSFRFTEAAAAIQSLAVYSELHLWQGFQEGVREHCHAQFLQVHLLLPGLTKPAWTG